MSPRPPAETPGLCLPEPWNPAESSSMGSKIAIMLPSSCHWGAPTVLMS